MPQKKYIVDLTALEKLELENLLGSGHHQSRKLTRARILLLANDGKTDDQIVHALQTARPTVERTRKRFVEEGLDCLQEKLRHGARPRLDERRTSASDGRRLFGGAGRICALDFEVVGG